MSQIKKLPKVNINHALVFAVIGFFFGIAMTSFVCLFQKTSNQNAEKGMWDYFIIYKKQYFLLFEMILF